MRLADRMADEAVAGQAGLMFARGGMGQLAHRSDKRDVADAKSPNFLDSLSGIFGSTGGSADRPEPSTPSPRKQVLLASSSSGEQFARMLAESQTIIDIRNESMGPVGTPLSRGDDDGTVRRQDGCVKYQA